MKRWFRNGRAALAFGALGALVAAAGRAQAPSPAPCATTNVPTYANVSWSELTYSAHKFFLGAATTIKVERVPQAAVTAALRPAAAGQSIPIPARESAAITVDTELPFGRVESVRLFFDPTTGAALGGEKTSLGGSAYHKVFRYTEGGLYTWRSAPTDQREEILPPAEWSARKAYLVRPLVAPPPGAPVADSYALIYLVSAARLHRRGDTVRVLMLADDRYVEVAFVAGGLTYQRASFEEVLPDGARRRERDVLVRQVKVTARALGAAESSEDVELGFLGMRGTLTVDLEVESDVPVALSGRVQHIGELTVWLNRAVLDREPPRGLR
jgi:hypothetical protein